MKIYIYAKFESDFVTYSRFELAGERQWRGGVENDTVYDYRQPSCLIASECCKNKITKPVFYSTVKKYMIQHVKAKEPLSAVDLEQ
jgi:hypothetical protein